MALPASNAVVLATLAGAPLIAVASQTDRPGLVFWAQPEITRISDLQGKTVGITRPGSLTHFLTLALGELAYSMTRIPTQNQLPNLSFRSCRAGYVDKSL